MSCVKTKLKLAAAFIVATIICGLLPMSFVARAPDFTEEFSRETYESSNITLKYRLYIPEDYDPAQKYPLVLTLHGSGGRGDDNEIQLLDGTVYNMFRHNILSETPAIILSPQCPETTQWVLTDWTKGIYSIDDVPESDVLDAVFEVVLLLKEKYSVDEGRIYVTGLSMGGYGTWDMITRHQGVFAAAVPICGAGDPSKAAEIVKSGVKIWAFHGSSDSVVPFSGSEITIEAIKKVEGEVKFTVFANGGHDAWNPAYSQKALFEWMFSQTLVKAEPPNEIEDILDEPVNAPTNESVVSADKDIAKPSEKNIFGLSTQPEKEAISLPVAIIGVGIITIVFLLLLKVFTIRPKI